MKIFENFDLTDYNSYRVNARCRAAYFPEKDEDIVTFFEQKKGSDYILLGGGNNVIFTQEYYDKDFIIFADCYGKIEYDGGNIVTCQAGCSMKELSEFALENNLSGLETFYDIPSSLGGAIVMNAGAGGEDMKALLLHVWYFDPSRNSIEVINKEGIGFEYRNSFFQKNPHMIVCGAALRLEQSEPAAIKNKMEDIKEKRWAKQPREYPNAGSVFKRPPGRFVGPMIDELGLKGYTIGGAKISEKHSGFIVNTSSATGADILQLAQYVQKQVAERFNVELEIEQRII